MQYNFITIEGNTGAGKTSLCHRLAEDFGANLILETFEENPFLADAYHSPEVYAFRNEMYFLLDRYNQFKRSVEKLDLNKNLNICDYLFNKSLLYARVNLPEKEYPLFEAYFHILNKTLLQPQLLVYIHSTVPALLKKIKKRGRGFEQNVRTKYLQDVEDIYFEHFKSMKNQRILILHCDAIDFVEKKHHYDQVIEAIDQKYEPGIHHKHFSS